MYNRCTYVNIINCLNENNKINIYEYIFIDKDYIKILRFKYYCNNIGLGTLITRLGNTVAKGIAKFFYTS